MNEIVERVARAIDPDVFKLPRINLNAWAYEEAYRKARAAIAAMREPTEAMKVAAFGPILYGGRTGPVTKDRLNQMNAIMTYQAMIDAALSE